MSYCCCRLIHLPLLNFLLGFPIQLLGLALLPYFGVKYLVEKDSIKSDAGDAFVSVLPPCLYQETLSTVNIHVFKAIHCMSRIRQAYRPLLLIILT